MTADSNQKSPQKVSLTIDGKAVRVDPGTTILAAARQIGCEIPTLCHHEALSDHGGCRVCVVEVDGAPKLVASCVTPVRAGMTVVTTNDRIIEARKTVVEFLFAERNHNCMFCPQSGDCELQQLAYDLKMDHLTVSMDFVQFPADFSNDHIGIDHSRCILCGRCVRVCKEIVGARVLGFNNRGPDTLVGLDLNQRYADSTCLSCGACLQVCPTGAIYHRKRAHYAVYGRKTDWHTAESFCPQCGLLCPTKATVSHNTLIKLEGHLSANGSRPERGQLCYRGRFEVFKSDAGRLLRPMVRMPDGNLEEIGFPEGLDLLTERMGQICDQYGSQAIFGLASSRASTEGLIYFHDLLVQGFSAGYVDTLDGRYFRNLKSALNGNDDFREALWETIDKADLVLMLSANPYQSQPALAALLRKGFLENKMAVVGIGPKDWQHPFGTCFLPIPKNGMAALLKALSDDVRRRLERSNKTGSKNVEDRLRKMRFNQDKRGIFADIAERFSESVNPLVVAGPALYGDDGVALGAAMTLAGLKGPLESGRSRLIILKPAGNSAGAWQAGIPAAKGLAPKTALRGGLILLEGENYLDKNHAELLGKAEFVAIISAFRPKITGLNPDLLLPRPLWTEEEGSYAALDGHRQAYKVRLLAPPESVPPLHETLAAVARRIGFAPSFMDQGALRRRASAPDGLSG